MRVLLVSAKTNQSPGGIATWTERYMNVCVTKNISVDLVNTCQVGKRAKQGNARRNMFDEAIRTKNIFKTLKEKEKQGKYDVAHINSSCGKFGLIRDFLVIRSIKKNKIKTIVHFHCDIPFWIDNRISKNFLKKILGMADQVLVLCDNSQQYLEKNFGVNSIKVPNFVDEKICKKDSHIIRKNIKKVLFVGYVQPEKGIKELYEVAEKFQNVDFFLAGQVRDDVKQWKTEKNVHFLGCISQDEVIKQMDDSDLFLFPTHSEGFSMSLAESMARGLPIITTNVGANLDMLENKGGIVVEKGNVKAMIDAMDELADEKKRRYMSEWCKKKIISEYTTHRVMQLLYNIYIRC